MGADVLVGARAVPHGRLRELPRRRRPGSSPRIVRRREVHTPAAAQAALRPGQLLPDQPEHPAGLGGNPSVEGHRRERLSRYAQGMPAAVRPSPWSKLARAGRLALPLVLGVILLATSAAAGQAQTGGRVVLVGYKTPAALRGALDASGGRLLRQLPQIRVAVVQVPAAAGTATLRGSAGIGYVADPVERRQLAEPALAPAAVPGGAYEWQYAATHLDQLSAADLAAAAPITIAVIDSGADMTAPDLAAKSPAAWSVLYGSTDVSDVVGHGTFVSSLAAGSPTNGEGIAGFGGSAQLLVIQAGGLYLDDVDIAAAITYAVDHGAKI